MDLNESELNDLRNNIREIIRIWSAYLKKDLPSQRQ